MFHIVLEAGYHECLDKDSYRILGKTSLLAVPIPTFTTHSSLSGGWAKIADHLFPERTMLLSIDRMSPDFFWKCRLGYDFFLE